MTMDEMKSLRRGDLVRHRADGMSFIVMENFGKRVTAVRTADMTNPIEWELVEPVSDSRKTPGQQAFEMFIEESLKSNLVPLGYPREWEDCYGQTKALWERMASIKAAENES